MRKILLIILFSVLPLIANADMESYFKARPVKIGDGKYYYKGLIHAYDIALYSPDGAYDAEKVFALELVYQTDIEGKDIAEKSIEEMKGIQALDEEKSAEWLKKMEALFPNVKDGTSLVGVNLPGKGAVFFKDRAKIGEINDPEFAKAFFGIWLSPKTSEPKLRRKLLANN